MSNFLNKNKYTVKSGKSINDAVEAALAELGESRENVEIEVINEGSKGFLGLGAKDAVVKVTVKQSVKRADNANRAPERKKKPAAKKAVKANETKASAVKPAAVKAEKKAVKSDPDTASGRAEAFLNDLFAAMNVDIDVTVENEEADELIINLSGDNMGIVIGKRGDTLDSIQYLTSLVVNRSSEEYIRVTIDTENYREKRTAALEALANRIAAKVVRTGRKFTLEPMNPYERRVIHANLQNFSGVTTFSVGKEPYRKVVVAPENAKPRYDKRDQRYGKKRSNEGRSDSDKTSHNEGAKKVGSYKTTYKADFKATPHKAEYKSYEEYLAAQNGEIVPPMNKGAEE